MICLYFWYVFMLKYLLFLPRMSNPLLQDLTDSDQTITGIPITIKWKIISFIFSLTFKMNCLEVISQGVVGSADIVT
mgnify:CR=1 FL=1